MAEPTALLARGEVRHKRLRPALHAFAYPSFFVVLPLRALARQAAPLRWGLLRFEARDHGDGGSDALAWVEGLLRGAGVADATGEIWLHTFPRVLGFVFKPVSFWYCERADGSLAAIVAEVNNTFGERHVYVLSGPQLAWGHEQVADKVFHVSPFCSTSGRYRFRFMRTADRLVARVDHDDALGQPLLQTSQSGRLQPLTPASARAVCLAMPLMTLGVVLRIHWQALQLWLKRVPFFRKPEPPSQFVSRSST
ncbi:DUF1365 domain-containing protein [Roseateles paludis]|jgi:DUF1365 family protein|uniref:DUF1365 domain-containing protein n=1 Tax=Roseateles paludis TaxID=3145238 RepID=A0ABV0FW66_9BURK